MPVNRCDMYNKIYVMIMTSRITCCLWVLHWFLESVIRRHTWSCTRNSALWAFVQTRWHDVHKIMKSWFVGCIVLWKYFKYIVWLLLCTLHVLFVVDYFKFVVLWADDFSCAIISLAMWYTGCISKDRLYSVFVFSSSVTTLCAIFKKCSRRCFVNT